MRNTQIFAGRHLVKTPNMKSSILSLVFAFFASNAICVLRVNATLRIGVYCENFENLFQCRISPVLQRGINRRLNSTGALLPFLFETLFNRNTGLTTRLCANIIMLVKQIQTKRTCAAIYAALDIQICHRFLSYAALG